MQKCNEFFSVVDFGVRKVSQLLIMLENKLHRDDTLEYLNVHLSSSFIVATLII